MQSTDFAPNAISETIAIYDACGLSDEAVRTCSTSGTLIDIEDALFMIANFNADAASKDKGGGEEEEDQTVEINVHHFILLLHPNNAEGHRPFQISRGQSAAAHVTFH